MAKTDTQIATLLVQQMRRGGLDIPGDAIHELEIHIADGYDELRSSNGRDPRLYGRVIAERAVKHYAAWCYLSEGGNGAQAARRYEVKYREARREWSKAAALEEEKEGLENNPYRRPSDDIQEELGDRSGGFLHVSGPGKRRRYNTNR
jgi:hypothetical protein